VPQGELLVGNLKGKYTTIYTSPYVSSLNFVYIFTEGGYQARLRVDGYIDLLTCVTIGNHGWHN